MRKHRVSSSDGPSKSKRLARSAVAISVSIVLSLFVAGIYLWRFLRSSEYFKISDVIFKGPATLEVSHLKGQNIFTVDLKKESQYLLSVNPFYNRIRIIRILPNRLFVDFLKREPVALLKLHKYLYVDEDSVVFDIPAGREISVVPLITGLDSKVVSPRPGTRCNIKELTLTLNIIKAYSRQKLLRFFTIKRIDVSSLADISLYTIAPLKSAPQTRQNEGSKPPVLIEIKMGQDNWKEKINMLSDLLLQAKNDWAHIKYIDLRFREPVIKLNPTTAKDKAN